MPEVGQREHKGLSGARVLVVEDHATTRRVLVRWLQRQGCEVHAAVNGVAAAAWLETAGNEVDLVIADLHMPGMSGAELVACVRAGRAGRADVPVVIVTADAGGAAEQRVLMAGANAVLAKPISIAALEALLMSIVAPQGPVSSERV